jgi:hypothetical protein
LTATRERRACSLSGDNAVHPPETIEQLVLIAPTWRGPFPTMMVGQRPWFGRVRAAVDNAVVGPLLYRLNVSAPVVRRMAQRHVYSAPTGLPGIACGKSC